MPTIVQKLQMGSKTVDTDEFSIVRGGIGGSGMNPVSGPKLTTKKPDFQILSNIVEFDVLTQGYNTSGATKIASGITDSISGTSLGFYPYNMSSFTGKSINFVFTGNTQFLTWNGVTATTKNIFSYNVYKYNKNYVDPKTIYDVKVKSKSSLHPFHSSIKQDVRVATISNIANFDAISLSNEVFDGLTMSQGDRILVRSQTDSTKNGIYKVGPVTAAAKLLKASDWNEDSDIIEGVEIYVKEGNTYGNTTQRLVTTPPYVFGTTNVKFSATTATSFPKISADTQGYVVDGIEGKELRLYRDNKYTFNIDAIEHPFYISKSMFGNGLSAITSGISVSHIKYGNGNFVEKGKLEFTPNVTTPDTVYYASEVDSNMGGKINIYTGAFVPLIHEKTLQYSAFTGNSPTLIDSIPNSKLEDKGEYLIKGVFGFTADLLTGKTLSFEDKNETFKNRGIYNLYEDFTINKYENQYKGFVDYFYDYKILSGLTGITVGGQPVINTNLPYRIYDKTYDTYFVSLKNPDEPVFNFADLASASTLTYVHEKFSIGTNGQTRFILTHPPLGDVMVNVNGLTLKPGNEWTGASINSTLADNRIVDLVDNIYDESGDTITTSYVRGTGIGQSYHIEQHQITAAITSGTTGNQGTNKVYFNTTESTYEYYLDIEAKSEDGMSIILNGAKLTPQSDYSLSTSLNKRIIFLNQTTLALNDIVLAYYIKPRFTFSGITGNSIFQGSLKTRTPEISWFVPPTVDENGSFQVQMTTSTDTGFTDIRYSATAKYSANTSSFKVTMPKISGSSQTLLYRIKNDRTFTTIKKDILSATTFSRIVEINTQSPEIDKY